MYAWTRPNVHGGTSHRSFGAPPKVLKFLVTVLTDNAWVENEGNQDPEDGESMRRTIMESLDGLTSFSISVTWIANANEKDIR